MRRPADARAIAAEEIGPLFADLDGANGIVAAVSGGPDSTCLMHLLAAWGKAGERPRVTVATVDHGLRPDSAREARTVSRWAKALGLRHRTLPWRGGKPETGIQEAAREARYRLLVELAHETKASHVVTAHTLDDQAETVVMRLLRGTGVGGLGAMRASAARDGVTLLRPLLGIAKARLVATCEREGWPYLSDPSNSDTRFARARLRGEVMPFLARHGLTAERLATLAERARRDADALAAHAAVVLEEIARRHAPEAAPGLELDGTRLKTEPDAVLLRVTASAVAAVAGGSAPPLRLERFEARVLGDLRTALRSGAALRMNLGGALLHLRADGRIVISPEPPRRSAKNKAFPDE